MDSTNNIPTTPNCGFESLIEDEEAACLVRRITLTSYDDLYRLVKASISPDDLPNSELERFGRAFARYFGVFLFDVRMQNPTETFLADLGRWIKEHRHECRCPVVLLPSAATSRAVAALAETALVLFQRPQLADDLTSFFETMMSKDTVLRCDLWDIVTATQNRGYWELVICTGTTTDADQLEQAGNRLLTSFTNPTTPPTWLVSFTADSEISPENPFRPIYLRLADNVKDGMLFKTYGCSVVRGCILLCSCHSLTHQSVLSVQSSHCFIMTSVASGVSSGGYLYRFKRRLIMRRI